MSHALSWLPSTMHGRYTAPGKGGPSRLEKGEDPATEDKRATVLAASGDGRIGPIRRRAGVGSSIATLRRERGRACQGEGEAGGLGSETVVALAMRVEMREVGCLVIYPRSVFAIS